MPATVTTPPAAEFDLLGLLPVAISALALLVSFASFAFSVSARPRLRMRVLGYVDNDVYKGSFLDVFNVGRRAIALSDVGILHADGSQGTPIGRIGPESEPDSARVPMVLEPGHAARFHLKKGSAEWEKHREENGYVVTVVGRKSLRYRDGVREIRFRPIDGIGGNWS